MTQATLLVLLFVGLLIAAFRDIKTREVPDTVSLGLITLGLLGGLITALAHMNVWIFIEHLCGFLIGTAIGLLMFYGKQWGGGDAKLIMGTGAILGFSFENFQLLEFILLLVFLGAIYGMVYTVALAIIHRKVFLPAFKKLIRTKKIHRIRLGLVATGIIALILFIFAENNVRILLGFFLIGTYLIVYVWIFIKTIEENIMTKQYPVGKLTEGDWLAEDVKIKGKITVKQKNTGITKEQIAQLKRSKIRHVIVREGIPFVPSFLLAFIGLLITSYWLDISLLMFF